MSALADRVYENAGNAPVVAQIDRAARAVLDVGCGAGDNAALLRARDPHKEITGITASAAEAARAGAHLRRCVVADLERGVPPELSGERFDALLFSHVLEHLRDPAATLAAFLPLLRPGGACVIAVPNVLNWRERAQFLAGRFEYASSGVLDETHLRFFTYDSAPRLLLARAPELRVVTHTVTGSVPLWILRRHVLPARLAARVDELGCALRPNLFGSQIVIKALKRDQGAS